MIRSWSRDWIRIIGAASLTASVFFAAASWFSLAWACAVLTILVLGYEVWVARTERLESWLAAALHVEQEEKLKDASGENLRI